MQSVWDWVFVCIFLIAIILLYSVSSILPSCFGLLFKKIVRRFAMKELVAVKELYLLPVLRPSLSRKQLTPLKIKYIWMSSRVR